METEQIRGCARGGIEGAIVPRSEHASPLSEGERLFFGDF